MTVLATVQCSGEKKKKNHSENFKALLLNIWQVSAHLLNAFRALVITTMGTYRKLWLQYFELSCNTKQNRSLDASVIIFLSRKKEKKKSKAFSLLLLYEIKEEQESIMT